MEKKIIETEVVFGKKEAMIPRVKSATVKGLVVWTSMVCQQYNEVEYDTTEQKIHMEQYLKVFFISYLDFSNPTSIILSMFILNHFANLSALTKH